MSSTFQSIDVARVTFTVAVGVQLTGVAVGGAVVGGIEDAVVVGVDHGGRVAGVADAVAIAVGLIGVGFGRAVVLGVDDAVLVDIAVDLHLRAAAERQHQGGQGPSELVDESWVVARHGCPPGRRPLTTSGPEEGPEL